LNHTDGKLKIESKMKELLKMDEQVFKKDLIPQQQSIIKKLASQETDKKQILVIGRHRYYNQLSFFAMEADITQTGK
jgi:hypothetical protein